MNREICKTTFPNLWWISVYFCFCLYISWLCIIKRYCTLSLLYFRLSYNYLNTVLNVNDLEYHNCGCFSYLHIISILIVSCHDDKKNNSFGDKIDGTYTYIYYVQQCVYNKGYISTAKCIVRKTLWHALSHKSVGAPIPREGANLHMNHIETYMHTCS